VSLLLKGHVSRNFSRLGLIETSESITADYDILVNLSNCLHTILHEFDLLIPYAGSDLWLEDSHGIVRIGSWQYHRPEPVDLHFNVDKDLQEKLEMVKWVKPPHVTGDASSVPKWLSDARNQATDAHGEVKSLLDLAAAHDSDNTNATIVMCKDKLQQGHMTGAEFKLFMERELRYGKSMKPEPSFDEQVVQDEEKKFLGLNLPINVVRFAHKIKGVVGHKKNKMSQQGRHSDDFDAEKTPNMSDTDTSKNVSSSQNVHEEEDTTQHGDSPNALTLPSSSETPLKVEKRIYLEDASSIDCSSEEGTQINAGEDVEASEDDVDGILNRYSRSSDEGEYQDSRNISYHKNVRMQSRSRHDNNAIIDGIDKDGFATNASSTSQKSSISEVMDRLHNMELLLATVLPSSSADNSSDSDGEIEDGRGIPN